MRSICSFLLTGFSFLCFAACAAHAACVNPAGNERDLIYNKDYHIYQFCNGTVWMGAGPATAQPPQSGDGYFVMSKGTFTGNMGGDGTLAGPDAKCLADLTANTGWRGYADANARGLLIAAKVQAFICGGPYLVHECNVPNASTTYFFADANDGSHGGASFTADASGSGPGDNANWAGDRYFGSAYSYWSNRNSLTDTAWDSSTWDTGHECMTTNPWDTGTSAKVGAAALAAQSDIYRWAYGAANCDVPQHLICIVNP